MNNIIAAMHNYNHDGPDTFNLIDAVVLNTIISGSYTTDSELASWSLSSLSTVKRSINKLCTFGFITKHITPNHIKTLEVHQDTLNKFLSDWS